jgi:hypothetical protein
MRAGRGTSFTQGSPVDFASQDSGSHADVNVGLAILRTQVPDRPRCGVPRDSKTRLPHTNGRIAPRIRKGRERTPCCCRFLGDPPRSRIRPRYRRWIPLHLRRLLFRRHAATSFSLLSRGSIHPGPTRRSNARSRQGDNEARMAGGGPVVNRPRMMGLTFRAKVVCDLSPGCEGGARGRDLVRRQLVTLSRPTPGGGPATGKRRSGPRHS